MTTEFSDRRLYLGNLPKNATKKDVEDLFKSHGHGEIVEIKLMSGFGFVEYSDPADARDVVPAFHGKEFMNERLTVQFARGTKNPRKDFDNNPASGDPRPPPRPRRTGFKMNISGMAPDTSWQDLKDFARKAGVDVVYSEVARERDGRGMVEFETAEDLKSAIRQLDATEFKGNRVTCNADSVPGRDRGRSRSPPYRHREYSPGGPRGFRDSSPRGHVRERSPAPRGYREYPPRDRSPRREPYYGDRNRDRERERFSPPPIYHSRRPIYEPDEPPHPRSYAPRGNHSHYDDGYHSKRYEDERYATNGRGYEDRRAPSPRRRSPRRYEDEYSGNRRYQ